MLEELYLDDESASDHPKSVSPSTAGSDPSSRTTVIDGKSPPHNGLVRGSLGWHQQTHIAPSERRGGPLTFRFSRTLVPPRRKRKPRPQDDARIDDIANSTITTRLMGGMRGDPFNAFPIEPKDCVPQAVDNFVQSFIPERIIRPYQAVPGIEKLAHNYFQLVISDVCMFEATVAHVEASHTVAKGILKPTREVLHHQGQALTHLQNRLADPVKRLDDVTLHTIINIMGTHFFFGELHQHRAHLAGLWSLVEMRGGIDTLGWEGSLKQTIETITSFVQYQTSVEVPSPPPNPAPIQEKVPLLEYPSHPFSPDLSASIARLPVGFSNIALKRTLSLQTIELLVDTHEQDLAYRNRPVDANPTLSDRRRLYAADKALQLLKAEDMPSLERMIIGGLMAYTVQAHHSANPDRTTTAYDEPLRNFIAEIAQYVFVNYEHPALLWVVLCFAAIQSHILTEGSTRVDFFHHTILRFKQTRRWSSVEKAVKEYCWTDERLMEWKWAWQDAVASHKPQGYEYSMSGTSGASSRQPSITPDVEGSSMITGSVSTPFLIEGEGRQAKAEVVELGLGVIMEGET